VAIRPPYELDARVLAPDQCTRALRAFAVGWHPMEAAVELLIEDGRWLADERFLRRVGVAPAPDGSGVLTASPDWSHLTHLVTCAHLRNGKNAILAIAIGLISDEYETGWSFPDLVAMLTYAESILVMRALLHAKVGPDEGPVRIDPFGELD
jgi:hypothetical protein